MIITAERRFPVRIRIAVAPAGPGQRYTLITAWLDENCTADRWAMTPSETRGALGYAGGRGARVSGTTCLPPALGQHNLKVET
jgi:hypothetical protein